MNANSSSNSNISNNNRNGYYQSHISRNIRFPLSLVQDNAIVLNYNNNNNNNMKKFLFSFFFISLFLVLPLFDYSINFIIPDADASNKNFCKGVKFKDEGHNDYNIILGTSQIGIADCIFGTNDKDVIIGRDGEDFIKGKDDDDNINGGYGDDKIYGNDGHDNVQGGVGSDILTGDDGNDVLFGGFDDDYLSGADDNDELYGDFGQDILEGGKGADYFDCGENYDVVLDYDPGDGDILSNNCEQVIKKK